MVKDKKTKDPNAPKRAMSAFFMFSGENRKKVVKQHPNWKVSEVAAELGRQWRGMTAAQKVPFEKQAAEDKKRYEKEIAVYKKGGAGTKSPKKK